MATIAWPAPAPTVEFRLVAADNPDTTVDAFDRQQTVYAPVPGPKGMVMEKVGLDVTCWARGILLDGEPLFEIYHDGKYVDRVPRARRTVSVGRHVIAPGEHAFTVAADGAVAAESPELIADAGVLKIKAYPVTIRAFNANPEEGDLPPAMRVAPLPSAALRDATEMETAAAGRTNTAGGSRTTRVTPRELLPLFDDFAPLTVWLPANQHGHGYMLHPMGYTFHLTPERLVAGAGGADPLPPGVRVDGRTLEIPLMRYPVRGDANASLVVAGVQKVRLRKDGLGAVSVYPRREAYDIRTAAEGAGISLAGDLLARPVKTFGLDQADALAAPRALLVELGSCHLHPGQAVDVNWQAIAPRPSGAKGEPQQAGADRLADAGLEVQFSALGDTAWRPAQVTAGALPGQARLSMPDIPDGIYRLRFAARSPSAGAPPVQAEVVVTVAPERPWGVGVFTPRGRDAFFRGESFWLGLGVVASGQAIPAGTSLSLELVDERGNRFPLAAARLATATRERDSLIVRVPGSESLKLSAGRYRLDPRAGAIAGRPLTITMVEPEPATHFTTLIPGKYNPEGRNYAETCDTGEGADDLVEAMAGVGVNAFMGMNYSFDRVTRRGAAVEQLARECPALGPWESWAQPSGRDLVLNACVRNNVRFWENLFTYNDCSLPRGERILATASRFAGLESQSMRFSPAFQGACLYDEVYLRSMNDGLAVVTAFEQAGEIEFTKAHPGLTSAKCLKALDRYAGRPFGQRSLADLATWRQWAGWEDQLWMRWGAACASGVREGAPGANVFILNRYWGANGGNLSANGYDPFVYSNCDLAACVMYKDGGAGDRPVFAAMQADVMRTREGLPVWTQIGGPSGPALYGHHQVRSAFLALSQKTEGFSFFNMGFDWRAPEPVDTRMTIRNIASGLCTPYGDFLMTLQKGYRQVAIVYSHTARELQSRKTEALEMQVEGIWVACLRAGYPADILYDEQVLAGKALDYGAVFVPGFTYEDECPPDLLQALRRLVNAGKTVMVERSSKLPVEGVVKAPTDFDEYDDKLGGSFPRYIDFEFESVFDQTERTRGIVAGLLEGRVPPAARHDRLVGPDWQRFGQGEYLFAANYAPVGFSGLCKTFFQAPDVAHLTFPKRPPVCYDVLQMRRCPVKVEGDWMSVDADMRRQPGALLAFLPEPIAGVGLRAAPAVLAGGTLEYTVAVQDAQGRGIDASFPLEVRLMAPDGRPVLTVYRAAAPQFHGTYAMPVNVPAGAWTLRVRELISGAGAEASVMVQAAGEGGGLKAGPDAEPVRVYDAGRVAAFAQRKDAPLSIVLDTAQDWVRPEAERLKSALAARGVVSRIVAAADVALPPSTVGDGKALPVFDGTRLWRGDVIKPAFRVDGPVVLMGKRNENRLIEALIRRDALDDALTTAFPGPHRAIVAWTRRAFSADDDTVSLLAVDSAGLQAAVDRLLALGQGQLVEEQAPARVLATAKPAPGTALAAGRPVPAESALAADRLSGEDLVRAIDVDPESGAIAVGTFGYGDNLFCLNADGALRWKTFLPEHDLALVRWLDGGARLVAFTRQGGYLFIVDGRDGHVLRKTLASEWPDMHWGEGAEGWSASVALNPPLRQILVRGRTGILALDYDGRKLWFYDRVPAITAYPPERLAATLAAQFPRYASVGDLKLAPDGTRLAVGDFDIIGSTPGPFPDIIDDLWAFRPKVLDARTGAIVAAWTGDVGCVTAPEGWSLDWPAGAPMPWVVRTTQGGSAQGPDRAAAMHADGSLGPFGPWHGRALAGGGSLGLAPGTATRRDAQGLAVWQLAMPGSCITGLDRMSPDGTRLYRSLPGGRVVCIDVDKGAVAWERRLPESGLLVGCKDGIVAGTANGWVMSLKADGSVAWQVDLRRAHEPVSQDYPAYVRKALRRDRDSTGECFPPGDDRPGDYDGVLRFGTEQLVNTGFETDGGWISDPAPQFVAQASEGRRALQVVPGAVVGQALERRVIPQATYLLEFKYRPSGDAVRLFAGARFGDGQDKAAYTLSPFTGHPDEWAFGRVAIKTHADTRALQVGFEAQGGSVLVDDVHLRAVRFPSANFLANAQLHAIEPTFVGDIRVVYNRIPPDLKQRLVSQNRVAAFRQGLTSSAIRYTEEEAFLHNGRLDDCGSAWVYPPDAVGFAVTLMRTSWISHLVLYLNNTVPEDAYRCFSVEAVDPQTKVARTVAVVRNNHRRFVVVQFPEPLQADVLRILPGNQMHAKRDSLTEVEVYGPLAGPEAAGDRALAGDPGEWPMLMGTPSHVPDEWPEDLAGTYVVEREAGIWGGPDFAGGALAADGLFLAGNADGAFHGSAIVAQSPAEPRRAVRPATRTPRTPRRLRPEGGPQWKFGSIPALATPAWYGGRLIAGFADGRLAAVADNGLSLWSFQTGGRVYTAPAPVADDVFAGSDDGRLYKVDIDSGILLWEFATGGKVRGAPAVADGRVFVPSWDGFLYAVDTETGRQAWKAGLAPESSGAAAVHDGKVYVGDEAGGLHAFGAADGREVWRAAMADRVSACPVVTPAGVLFAGEAGALELVGGDGKPVWTAQAPAGICGQPVATRGQFIVPTESGVLVLRQSDGQPDDRFHGPAYRGHCQAALPYEGRLCLLETRAWSTGTPPVMYGNYDHKLVVWAAASSGKEKGGTP